MCTQLWKDFLSQYFPFQTFPNQSNKILLEQEQEWIEWCSTTAMTPDAQLEDAGYYIPSQKHRHFHSITIFTASQFLQHKHFKIYSITIFALSPLLQHNTTKVVVVQALIFQTCRLHIWPNCAKFCAFSPRH